MNFTDAVAEGDGDRIMHCWKFLLLYFYSDTGTTKYALEALYLQLQQRAILSLRQAYQQRWNRSVNNHGGNGNNVSLDLEVEQDNNSIKEGLRKLGPNLTHEAVTRVVRMLPVAEATVNNASKECNLMTRSGKHFVKTTRNDLLKILNLLVQADAFQETPDRQYKHFNKFSRSPLRGFGDSCGLYGKVTNSDITPGYKTDHSMITLSLSVTENPKGPGLWKLNTSFLGDVDFTHRVKTVISQTCEDYKDDNNVDDALLWEMIKLKVREASIFYGKEKAISRRKDESDLHAKVAYLEKKVEEPIPPQLKEELSQQLSEAKESLEKIYEYKTKGSILRSKTRWYNEGEKQLPIHSLI
ncbi:hypothetical protein ACROYT_G013872 [Oculina patagonica]